MKRLTRIVLTLILVIAGSFAYTKLYARLGNATPPEAAAAEQQADAIHVRKSAREMVLLRQGAVIRRYDISLGGAGDAGQKAREGDQRTPEGRYEIDWRNPSSIAYLSLHISYPNADDSARAAAVGHDPGGNIMIHGIANGWGALGGLHLLWDWTDGCIAVTNAQMREIWSLVPNGTPIVIEP